jgi:hypothetical protein
VPIVTVNNGTSPVIVILKKGHPKVAGKLYLMSPEKSDSAIFICTNTRKDIGDTVKLGFFKPNTPLVFMYIITDTTKFYAPLRGKRLYSGKNIQNVDHYISESEGIFGKKFAAAGQINESTVEVGFDASETTTFLDAIFILKGARIAF